MDGTLIRKRTTFEIVTTAGGDLVKAVVDGFPPLFYPVELFEQQVKDAAALLLNYRNNQTKS